MRKNRVLMKGESKSKYKIENDDGSVAEEKGEKEESDSSVRVVPPPQIPPTLLSIQPASLPIVERLGYPRMQKLYKEPNTINPDNCKP